MWELVKGNAQGAMRLLEDLSEKIQFKDERNL